MSAQMRIDYEAAVQGSSSPNIIGNKEVLIGSSSPPFQGTPSLTDPNKFTEIIPRRSAEQEYRMTSQRRNKSKERSKF